MSNLVKRLRVLSFEDAHEAADRLEALEAALRQAREALLHAAGAYDAIKVVGSDKSLPGYERCSAGNRAAIDAINTLLKD